MTESNQLITKQPDPNRKPPSLKNGLDRIRLFKNKFQSVVNPVQTEPITKKKMETAIKEINMDGKRILAILCNDDYNSELVAAVRMEVDMKKSLGEYKFDAFYTIMQSAIHIDEPSFAMTVARLYENFKQTGTKEAKKALVDAASLLTKIYGKYLGAGESTSTNIAGSRDIPAATEFREMGIPPSRP